MANFDELYEQYRQLVSYVISIYIPDREHAKDLEQDTWFKVWRSLPHLKHENNLEAWVGTIASRTAIDAYRRSRGIPMYSLDEGRAHEDLFAHDEIEERLDLMAAGDLLADLSAVQRSAIEKHARGESLKLAKQRSALQRARRSMQHNARCSEGYSSKNEPMH